MSALQKKNKGFTKPLLWKALFGAGGAGFMLLEVVLSVLIIASGVVFIMQSYLMSLRGAEITRTLTRACLFLEDKFFLLDIKGFKDGVEEGESSDIVAGEKYYRYDLAVWPLDDREKIQLNKVDLSIYHKRGNQNRKISISTFLKHAKD